MIGAFIGVLLGATLFSGYSEYSTTKYIYDNVLKKPEPPDCTIKVYEDSLYYDIVSKYKGAVSHSDVGDIVKDVCFAVYSGSNSLIALKGILTNIYDEPVRVVRHSQSNFSIIFENGEECEVSW